MDIKKDNAMYMQIAQIAAGRSYAKRLQVGCVIVKNNSIISFGWNGMPTGYDNCCEEEIDGKLVTRKEVQLSSTPSRSWPITVTRRTARASISRIPPAFTARFSFRSAELSRSIITSSIGMTPAFSS